MSARGNGKRDVVCVSTVSSMKLSAQRHAEAWGGEMLTTHVTEVATYFHYWRKVTCVSMENHLIITPTKHEVQPT